MQTSPVSSNPRSNIRSSAKPAARIRGSTDYTHSTGWLDPISQRVAFDPRTPWRFGGPSSADIAGHIVGDAHECTETIHVVPPPVHIGDLCEIERWGQTEDVADCELVSQQSCQCGCGRSRFPL